MMICKELRDKMWKELEDEAKAFMKKSNQTHNLNIHCLLENILMLDEIIENKEKKEKNVEEYKIKKNEGMWT